VERPYNIISLDTEADEKGFTYVYCVAGFYNGKEIKEVFKSRAQCVKFLFHRKWTHTILTGLNLAFDLNTLYGYNNSFNWHSIINMGKLITASPSKKEQEKRGFRSANDYLKIIDLGNFIQNLSLKGMADVFNINCHIDKHILGKDGTEAELTEACLSHCLTGVKIMEEIQNKIHNLGGNVKLTGPATSLDLFRRKYLKPEFQIYDFKQPGKEGEEAKINRTKKVQYMKRIGKACYVGGRVEAFRLGLYNDVGYLDINSSYPYQMSVRTFPDMASYKRYTENLSVEFLNALIEKEEGQALIKIRSPGLKIPFLHTTDNNGKLIFPNGVLYGWYTFPEIEYAQKLGYKILEIDEIASFRRSRSMFKEYVSDMMAYKAVCKPVAKLLANGLSGKFGQKVPENDRWKLVEDATEVKIDNIQFFSINGQIWEYLPPEEKPEEEAFKDFAYPLIIAYITAWGRRQEHETIMALGSENVLYMDTDSIIAFQWAIDAAVQAGKIWLDPKELGAYDTEYTNATVEIHGEKYYRIHEAGKPWTYHIKGVPGRVSVEYWRHRKAVYYRPRKIKTALRSGLQVNEFMRIFHQDRTEPGKRVYGPRGRSSEALTVMEG
jgi:hypothetical protein